MNDFNQIFNPIHFTSFEMGRLYLMASGASPIYAEKRVEEKRI